MLHHIRRLNPNHTLHELASPQFKPFGRIIRCLDFAPLIAKLAEIPVPKEGNIYVPDEPALHIQPLADRVKNLIYGGLDIEIGYCNGHSHSLNALEWHQGSEVCFAAAPAVIILAHLWDVENDSISSGAVSMFYVPAGTAFEMYATTLHLSPSAVDAAGFKMGIILLNGTNQPFSEGVPAECPTLFAVNKWLITHPEGPHAARGAHIGVTGANPTLVIE